MWRRRLKHLAFLVLAATVGAAAAVGWVRVDAARRAGVPPTPELWRADPGGSLNQGVGVYYALGFHHAVPNAVPNAVLQVHRKDGSETEAVTLSGVGNFDAWEGSPQKLIGALYVTITAREGRRAYGLLCSVPTLYRYPNGYSPDLSAASPGAVDRFREQFPAPSSRNVRDKAVVLGGGFQSVTDDQPRLVLDRTE
ncbi:hypothetical protein J0H58_18020 [bacterium]|nr:hypothetical protein [bacterium]